MLGLWTQALSWASLLAGGREEAPCIGGLAKHCFLSQELSPRMGMGEVLQDAVKPSGFH